MRASVTQRSRVHVPEVLGSAVRGAALDAVPLIAMGLVAAAPIALGTAAYRQRDLTA